MHRRQVLRSTTALSLLLIVAVGVGSVKDPATVRLFHAMRELGPISGWRCAKLATYVYEPTREQRDSALVEDEPERVVLSAAPDVEIDRVEVDLRGGDTIVWTHVVESQTRRVYVLSSGRLQVVSDDVGAICNSRLAAWKIIGEHNLG